MAFINQYLKVKWLNARKTEEEYTEIPYDSHACIVGEISQGQYDKGTLYLCPPKDTIKF